MLRARQFRIDPDRVVHETIDGETILIDLVTGTYYSLGGSGADIWGLLAEGFTDCDVIRELQRAYPADAEAAACAVAEMIDELQRDGLLEEAEPNGRPAPAAARDRTGEILTVDGPFKPAVLERYTDMQYFLLLDPIHEVADAGWPHPPGSGPSGTPPT